MNLSKYSATFFNAATALVFVFYVMAACSSASAMDNALTNEEVNSSDSIFTKQIMSTEFDLSSVTNFNFLAAGSPISQIYFNSGTSCLPQRQCYINKLVITGTGGDGRVGTWTSDQLPGLSQVPNNQYGNSGWWKPNKEIKLEMYFNGYSKKICRVSLNTQNSYMPRLDITYLGDLNCRIYERP